MFELVDRPRAYAHGTGGVEIEAEVWDVVAALREQQAILLFSKNFVVDPERRRNWSSCLPARVADQYYGVIHKLIHNPGRHE